MRVGIYNRWLATMGGGEKHSLAIAECLANKHEVSVISHTPVDKEIIGRRLALDLSAVRFEVVPEGSTEELSELTEAYDLFVNASHMDFFPARAPRSALLVYFPVPAERGLVARFRRWVGLRLGRWLMVPLFVEGAFGAELVGGAQVRRLGQRVRIQIPPSGHSYHLRFGLASQDPSVRRATLLLDGQFLKEVQFPPDQSFVPCLVEVKGTRAHSLTIEAQVEGSAGKVGPPFRMALTRLEVMHPRYRLYRLLFERWFKQWGLRLQGIPPRTILEIVDTYDAVWANSEFTRTWIARYWNRPSLVLPPPVDVERFRPGEKRKGILSVGRFFAGSHNKKHLVMVRAFREMVDEGLDGWELHLAGGTTPGSAHQEYLERVRALARGYPVLIHTDVPFDRLAELYAESAIYWHASGFGEDENREPIKFEHFGITTVEAMAAGCVPVVIGKGGQPEIVDHGRNGFLWNTLEELKGFTWRLVKDPDLRRWMADAAIVDSRRYDKVHFHQRLKELLQEMGVET